MAHVPFIAAADCAAFGLGRRALDEAGGSGADGWAEFRQSEDARYVGLTVPRVLLRRPYGDDGGVVDGFVFQERVWPTPTAEAAGQSLPEPLHQRLLWGNSAFVLAERLASAFARDGSAAAAWDDDDLLAVDSLPRFGYLASDTIEALVGPAEVHWPNCLPRRLGECGFLPLARDHTTGSVFFHGMQSCYQPPRRSSAEADAVAQAGAQLRGLLLATRFAQALRAMLAQAPQRWATRKEAEAELRAWLARHTMVGDDAGQGVPPARPLRSARLDVLDVPARPAG